MDNVLDGIRASHLIVHDHASLGYHHSRAKKEVDSSSQGRCHSRRVCSYDVGCTVTFELA